MTAIEVATSIIDKLQEENRVCLETLHKAQDTIKYSERQLAEKDRLIKVLEERLRAGTDGILEMTNRQKELTIKHLEMQIQKLLKENEDLEVNLEAIKAEICPKCEAKLLLKENTENRGISKSYKPPGKSKLSGVSIEKKVSQTACPNRMKSLERIVEHKDKRIMHLSKEVQRLTKLEKELTQKVYRLSKLMPMSGLPSEAVTDCLLQEIELLESQGCANGDINLPTVNALNKFKKVNLSTSTSKVNISKSTDRFKKSSSAPSVRTPTLHLPEYEQANESVESKVLFNKLQKLCNDINELKRLFAHESEKLSHGLNNTASEYHEFKIHLEEIISNLNDLVENILSCFNVQQPDILNPSSNTDDKYVISCLQERLRESLAIVTEYENENKTLKENLDKLKAQLLQQSVYSDTHKLPREREFKSFTDSKQILNVNDVKRLQEIIKIKDSQLEDAKSHLSICHTFIEELQKGKPHKQSISEHPKFQSCPKTVEATTTNYEQQNKELQKKLDVAERNIKTCETVIERLQEEKSHLEEENARIESELHMVKSKTVSEGNYQSGVIYSRLSDSHANTLKKFNQELLDKVRNLEESNAKLEASKKSSESKTMLLKAVEQDKTLLKSKLSASEKSIATLEKSVEILQDKLKLVEQEKNELDDKLKNIIVKNNLAETHENDVMALKNQLILKEEENRQLQESLRTLETKTLEMNHYRISLHQEIENLCKALIENEEGEDSVRRKAIYKAAVLHSAQALLRLDDNYNLKPDDSGRSSALEELQNQIEVYLTEVSRIHELLTIKEQERDELLKEYLDVQDDILRPSSVRHHESRVQGHPASDNLQSFPNLNPFMSPEIINSQNVLQSKTVTEKNAKFESSTSTELKILQEELDATKSVTNYLLSSCTRLEDLLNKERTDRAKCERELEVCHETVKDLKTQLSTRSNTTIRLNSLIEMMRSKECNDEITLEQLKSEIKWLIEENQKIFERITSTQVELCQCKEENCRIQNDLDSVKRQLLNEKYENAKVNNELKHLRLQISHSQSTLHDA